MAKERDSQRSRVWKAFAGLNLHGDKALPEVSSIRNFITDVQLKAPLKRRYARAVTDQVPVFDGRGLTHAHIDGPQGFGLYLNRNYRTRFWVLRMWAFMVHRRCNYSSSYGTECIARSGGAWHGWQYCSILLDLVRFGIGSVAHDQLKAAFDACGVRYSKPTKRKVNGEQQAAQVERGKKLALLKKRKKFSERFPDAVLIGSGLDAHFDDYWETLFTVSK